MDEGERAWLSSKTDEGQIWIIPCAPPLVAHGWGRIASPVVVACPHISWHALNSSDFPCLPLSLLTSLPNSVTDSWHFYPRLQVSVPHLPCQGSMGCLGLPAASNMPLRGCHPIFHVVETLLKRAHLSSRRGEELCPMTVNAHPWSLARLRAYMNMKSHGCSVSLTTRGHGFLLVLWHQTSVSRICEGGSRGQWGWRRRWCCPFSFVQWKQISKCHPILALGPPSGIIHGLFFF